MSREVKVERVIPLSEIYATLPLGSLSDKTLVLHSLGYAAYVTEVGRLLHCTCRAYRGFLRVPEYERLLILLTTREVRQEIVSLVTLLQPQYLYMQANTRVTLKAMRELRDLNYFK